MATYKHDEIVRRGEILTTNGLLPQAQAVIAGVGLNPTGIGVGAAKVTAMKTARDAKIVAETAKKNATSAEKAAHKAANKEMVSLATTARTIFKDDLITLAHLNLQTQYETVKDPETGAETQQAAILSQATADVIARWRATLSGAQSLAPANKAILTAAGWTAARVTATSALVEAYANADTAQRAAIQTFEQASGTLITVFDDVNKWYVRSRNLCLIAIKDADPNNTQNLRELLGLD